MNAIHRANISFGKKEKHACCLDCDDLISLHKQNIDHCNCGANWIGHYTDGKCETQPNPEDVIVYNFFRNLRPLIELFSPDKCFFVLEGHPQFRYDLYSGYKSDRIIKQASKQGNRGLIFKAADIIVNLLLNLPITICKANNFEADDTIGSVCENLKDESITIVSNDSDHIQLLQRGYSNIKIYNPIKKVFMEAPTYVYIQAKAILGDKSDSIPALLTPKKAEACINSPGLFQKFLDSSEENRSNFNRNRSLIEFRKVPEEELILQEGLRNYEKLKEEFSKMNFESIINEKSWEKFTTTFACIKY